MLKPHLPNSGFTFVFRAILKMIILYYLAFNYPNINQYKKTFPFSLLMEASINCLKTMYSFSLTCDLVKLKVLLFTFIKALDKTFFLIMNQVSVVHARLYTYQRTPEATKLIMSACE